MLNQPAKATKLRKRSDDGRKSIQRQKIVMKVVVGHNEEGDDAVKSDDDNDDNELSSGYWSVFVDSDEEGAQQSSFTIQPLTRASLLQLAASPHGSRTEERSMAREPNEDHMSRIPRRSLLRKSAITKKIDDGRRRTNTQQQRMAVEVAAIGDEPDDHNKKSKEDEDDDNML